MVRKMGQTGPINTNLYLVSAQQLTFLKKQSLKICIYLPSNDFDLRSSYSVTADWNEPKMLVTSTERAIVESEVQIPLRRSRLSGPS